MTEHAAVARRFALLLDTLDLDRAGFVAALDHAVSERTLYSILNGHRRPSRSLAVLIERTWGFRAEYLLTGHGEMWAPPRGQGSGETDDRTAAVLAAMAHSPEHARAVLRDLDDAVLWADLWLRTTRMLEDLATADGDSTGDARPARLAFAECMEVADLYAEMTRLRYHRRMVHLVSSFLRYLEDSGEDDPRHATLRGAATEREQALRVREDALRAQLSERARAPHPLEPAGGDSNALLLEQSIRSAIERL